jgi:hypothetical protein
MKTSSLQNNRPHLEAVLGPLSSDDDAKIRAIFAEAEVVLLEIANHFHHDRAGWEGTGLELTWAESGQVSISSHVGASVEGAKCVDFLVELRPGWYSGHRSSTLTWEVDIEIYADCHDAVNHSSLELVHEASARFASPVEAARGVLSGARELLRLATNFSLEHWLELTSDGG